MMSIVNIILRDVSMQWIKDSISNDEIFTHDQNFIYLLKDYKTYYDEQINKINSNFINNLAEVLIKQYHLKYYETFDKLLMNNEDVDRCEYDYNVSSFDSFFENIEGNIRVFTKKDLKILNSIIDIANLFLKNAVDENNFESLINSFYKFKEKLELNNFI